MKPLCWKVAFWLATLSIASCFGAESYLDNGSVKIGVELTKGGSITYLSPSGTTYNIINNYDLGRQVQQSYYSGPDNFLPTGATMHPSWKPWPWNPIQTGDVYGNRSLVLSNSNDGQTLYVKSRPMQWALNNVPGECTFESWITLNGNVATVSNRLVNFRTDTPQQFAARDQELPAVYTIGKLYKLVSYDGNAPFTGGAVTTFPTTPPPWLYWRATESWAALLNTTNWGLGVYYPGAVQCIGGFSGTINSGGPTSSSTGYMSPIYQEVIDSNIEYTYTYHLILGTLTEIRNWVYAQAYRPACDFVFDTDRRHWTFQQTTDAGWPLTNKCLRVSLNSIDPQMWSPPTVFYATNVPKLYLRAAYTIAHPAGRAYGQLFWETNSTGGLAEARSVQFPVVADGQYHTYELNLAAANNYSGLITRLRFDPAYNGEPGDFVDVKAISSNPTASEPPTSTMQISGTNVTISWPAAYNGWVLETSTGLSLPNWTPVPGVINNSVTVTANSGSGFFRLRRMY